jgi:hypothetical protein
MKDEAGRLLCDVMSSIQSNCAKEDLVDGWHMGPAQPLPYQSYRERVSHQTELHFHDPNNDDIYISDSCQIRSQATNLPDENWLFRKFTNSTLCVLRRGKLNNTRKANREKRDVTTGTSAVIYSFCRHSRKASEQDHLACGKPQGRLEQR